jgi:hypothetical protein
MSPDTTPDPDRQNAARMHHPPPAHRPGALSEHDTPAGGSARNRPRALLVIALVVLVAAFVVLHLTGVLGPGSH